MKPLQLDVWSDIACPWCYVGKRRLETALESFEGEVELRWHAFELDPNAPHEYDAGVSYAERLGRKYGRSPSEAQQMIDSMTQTAAADGLDFHFETIRPSNTFKAHRLLRYALEQGKQGALKERLMAAYLSEGQLMSDTDTLVRLAGEVGLDEEEARGVLESERFSAEVRRDEQEAAQIGIRGVPFFVVGGRYGVSGAQAPEALLEVLNKARAEQAPAVETIAADGELCGPEGCA